MTEEKYTAEQLEQMADQLLQEAAWTRRPSRPCRRPRC